jgi:hypothetical protein
MSTAPSRPTAAVTDAFFFECAGRRLFATWRAPSAAPRRSWVFCAPFAEEEKSARRTLAEVADALRAAGDAVLFFAYSGTGDSEGDFAAATLAAWRADIAAACRVAAQRAPLAQPCLAGVRLGASLAWQVAAETGAQRLVLLEPVLRGRELVAGLQQKKRLRAMLTRSEGHSSPVAATISPVSAPVPAAVSAPQAGGADDFDGWPLSAQLRSELDELDISAPARFDGAALLLLQVGPREQLGHALQQWSQALGAQALALKMQPFWNLVDYTRAEPLFATLEQW